MPVTETTRAKHAASKKKKAPASAIKTNNTKKGKSSSYNKYMNEKLAELKAAEPTKEHKDLMRAALSAWKKESGKANKV